MVAGTIKSSENENLFGAAISFTVNNIDYYVKGDSLFRKTTRIMYGDINNTSVTNRLYNFSPFEISEFGLEDGTVYAAKDIEINHSTFRTFLEKYKFKKMNL